MHVKFTITRLFHVPAQRLFDFTNDAANFISFAGYGPIPGILHARYETPGPPRLGSIRRIQKTDGTEHVEEITVFERPSRHVSRITGFEAPFSWLVREGSDDWTFQGSGGLTVVERTFTFELTTVFVAPVAWVLMHFMKEAVRRDLTNIMAKVGGGGPV